MNMVSDTSDNERLTVVIGQNAAQVAVSFFPQRLGAEKGTAVFRRENGMDQNFCERLRHEMMVWETGV
jgi:glycerol dehydrogenase-like iron-containing ADH family enzyme